MVITDASIFSRALTTIEIKKIEKYLDKNPREIYIGRATSMNGELIQYPNAKLIPSPQTLPNGKRIDESGGISNSVYKAFKVAPGLTFNELINELKPLGLVPVLTPIYLQGTVGGFIATNGSGFGSYKFGFIKGKYKEVYKLENNSVAEILTAKYSEVIEVDKEVEFAWSGIIIDGKEKYYVPTYYAKFLDSKGASEDTYAVLNELHNVVIRSFKRDYIPVILRYPPTSKSKVNSFNYFEEYLTYIINFNSPSKFYVSLGNIKFEDLEKLSDFLLKNKEIMPFPSLNEYSSLHLAILKEVSKKLKLPKQYVKIQKVYVDALKCINCGLCLTTCTAYKITKNPVYSPLGKIGRLIFEETEFEPCFGCAKDEEVCPVNIPIGELTTEGVNLIKTVKKPQIDITNIPSDITNLVNKLNEKYRNRPLFLLFVGCSAKYDPTGLRGFLQYLLDNGNNLPPEFSPKIRLVTEKCCGFDDFIAGDWESAKNKVNEILTEKKNSGAIGIYFLCPEGLYVYNKFSGDKGILAYEVLKKDIKEKVHAGCWAKKLGIKGDDDECAGLTFTTYQGNPYPYVKKQVLTICPFSTWKFGTISVYAKFYKSEILTQEIKEETAISFAEAEKAILDMSINAIKNALLNSTDEIAEKVGLWNLGGEAYFVTVSFPIVTKYFVQEFKKEIMNFDKKETIIKYINSILSDIATLSSKTSLIVDYIRSQNYDTLLEDVQKRITSSPRLEYTAMDLAKSDEMKKALKEILRKSVSDRVIERVLREIVYST